jgi:hypothetical protein
MEHLRRFERQVQLAPLSPVTEITLVHHLCRKALATVTVLEKIIQFHQGSQDAME